MRRLYLVTGALCALVGTAHFVAGLAEEKKTPTPDEKGVQQAMAALADGFNAADAAKIAAGFTTNAEYIDDAGNGVRGREAIQELFARFLEHNKGAKIQLTLDEARQVAPDVVLQDGESVCTVPSNGSQSTRRYAAVLVRQDRRWRIGSLREFPEESTTSDAADRLKELSWLLGDWVDEAGDGIVITHGRWSDDKRYLLRDFTIKVKGKEALSGRQRIGIDPLTGQIKGWAFDSQNGYGQTTWIKNGDQWLVKATGVTSDGETASATYTFKPVGKDRILWKSMHRVVGDRVEPDIEVTLVRKPPAPK